MFSRLRIALSLAMLVSLVFAIPAFAGGWAVITLDELPADVVADEPLTVGFTVLQHGRTPMNGLTPTITANLNNAARFVVDAEPGSKPGHYTATLTFPEEGEWSWSIQAFTMDQRMPELQVAAPLTAAKEPVTEPAPVSASISPFLMVRWAALVLGLVGLVLIFQRKSRLAAALTVAALAAGIASFRMGPAVPHVEAQKLPAESSLSRVELGRQLFIAKGCITCHYNNRAAARSEHWTVDIGAPDLSSYSSAPEILFIRLKDPAAAKSDTQMPNLGLKETEIEALIAFINSK